MTDRNEDLFLVIPGIALLVVAFLVPIGQMLALSVQGDDGPTLTHFMRFLGDDFYRSVLGRTVRLSLMVTFVCAVIGVPLAYIMARASQSLRLWLVIMVILPLMISVVVRTFGWMVLLSRSGLIPQALRELGLVDRNFAIMHTEAAIVIGLAQVLMPFMVLSILGVMMRIDPRLEEAARTMGCSFIQTMRTVVLPLSMPGVVAGSVLVFTLAASSFVTPNLLGGPRVQVLAASIYRSVTQTLDWQFAAAQAVILFVGVLLVLVPYTWIVGRSRG
jgi:putative spermidine/putrescine transport system permease protein